MIARHIKREDLDIALEKTSAAFGGNVIWNRAPEKVGRGYRFTLRVKDSKGPGHRRSSQGRRLVSACWHVHGTFFTNLPPTVIIRAGTRTFNAGDEWHDWNVGSIMYPLPYSKACDCGNMTTFNEAHMRGGELVTSTVRMIPHSAFMACPFTILMASHYRADNTCKCDDPEERKMMIAEWGYSAKDFKDIPLREA